MFHICLFRNVTQYDESHITLVELERSSIFWIPRHCSPSGFVALSLHPYDDFLWNLVLSHLMIPESKAKKKERK